MATVDDVLSAGARGPVTVYGATEPFCAYLGAALAEDSGAPLIAVVPDEDQARRFCRDLALFLAPTATGDPAAPPRALHVPAIDTSPYAELSPDRDAQKRRMTALFRLARGGDLLGRAVVVSARSLLRKVIPRAELEALVDVVCAGSDIDREATAALLVRAGYARTPVVEDPGTFAVRGGVVDVFPPLYRYPVRIDLFGDTVESLRFFDPDTQRTLRQLESVYLHPVRDTIVTGGADLRGRILAAADAAAHPSKATRQILERLDSGEEFVGIDTFAPAFHSAMAPLWDYVPEGARTLVFDPDGIARAAADELEDAESRYRERIDDHQIAFSPPEHYATSDELRAHLAAAPRRIEARTLELHGEGAAGGEIVRLRVDGNQQLCSELERARRQKADELIRPLAEALGQWRRDGWRVAIPCDGAGRRERLAALLRDYGIEPAISDRDPVNLRELEPGAPPTLFAGSLSRGFSVAAERLAVLTDGDIFGERRATSARQRAAAKRARAALTGGVADFSELSPGDYLVHQLHGVGLYRGLVVLPIKSAPMDFLHLEYSGGSLYLPVYRIGEVSRYVGAEGHKARLDKLGGQSFQAARKRAKVEVRKLAEELLQLYAQRAALPGHRYPPADAMFQEFEATFEFEETPDQQRAIDEVITDMESDRPMDRLVCGDVGYGKTEVALRALLKAALGGKQAALLAPTTVLVEQHYQTMARRFQGWPVRVARLSRFQPRRDQLATIKALAAGQIDAVVGTHRLLSKDVRFKDLGLVVIDEEQRFGVAHKERLKKMRTQVDVLTLTATPIPRTLHLAMTGLRDLSIIATPPADRRSIRTFVARAEDGVLREGIRRELSRGGQIFFVSPRITGSGHGRSLSEWAKTLRELVPEARVTVAHGQMSADELERAMVTFVNGEADILVSTTIVESGIDIPRANTMFVDHAERFGLAQLYQLRGRIGRSKERAFCYLLVPPPEKLTDEARRRLETLQRFTDLGAGFNIASHDLEIRGAGELLGARQSGTIAAVGFDAYTQMLEDAVAELRGEEIQRERDPELSVDLPGFIPDDYVEDTGQRLGLYKRLASAADAAEVADIVSELEDRYGPVPREVAVLGELMVLKSLARRLRAVSLDLDEKRLSLALGEDTPLDPARVMQLVAEPGSRFRLTPDMRLLRLFGEGETADPVAAARRALEALVSDRAGS